MLGTVQGSPLRSARASARPSGLDGACAQPVSWPLRDGQRRMALGWTDLDLTTTSSGAMLRSSLVPFGTPSATGTSYAELLRIVALRAAINTFPTQRS